MSAMRSEDEIRKEAERLFGDSPEEIEMWVRDTMQRERDDATLRGQEPEPDVSVVVQVLKPVNGLKGIWDHRVQLPSWVRYTWAALWALAERQPDHIVRVGLGKLASAAKRRGRKRRGDLGSMRTAVVRSALHYLDRIGVIVILVEPERRVKGRAGQFRTEEGEYQVHDPETLDGDVVRKSVKDAGKARMHDGLAARRRKQSP
jgi:hypothetical protein